MTTRKTAGSLGICAALTGLLLAACGSNPWGVPMHNTVTLDQANTMVDQWVNDIITALGPDARADRNDSLVLNQHGVSCNPEDATYRDTYQYAQRSFPLIGVRSDTETAFSRFRAWADKAKLPVDASHATIKDGPYVRVNAPDGYGATLEFNFGQFILSVSSPCVWRNGHPESTP